ncbi:methionyl-tRNA formyltransferase [Bacillus toyonensis]|uniref:methionyl-tRNA formyltransferase n=1 Tax=Bacillus toyonensis TaxID=155322 RepID=UPI0018D16791|nr:methionyl-tRNA formyltransferase [Bacillus toyonensis]MBH0357130.1 hypothetical protein [Bacillus toyonensis biovar Thuringiensis]
MKIILISSGESGYYALKELLNENFHFSAIVTITDEMAETKSTYKSFNDISTKNKIELFKTKDINSSESVSFIKRIKPDLIIALGWSQIIKKEILGIPALGVIGSHISFLPKYRGHSPLNWALVKGKNDWGVTLYFYTERVDYGRIINQKKFKIMDRDNALTLYNYATFLTIDMLKNALPKIKDEEINTFMPELLNERPLPKRNPEDGNINWENSSRCIFNLIRGVTKPFPGAFSHLNGTKYYIWEAKLTNLEIKEKPGTILEIMEGEGVLISTGDKPILLTKISKEDGLDIWADLLIHKEKIGNYFE